MKKSALRLWFAVLALGTLSGAANATVSLGDDIAYDASPASVASLTGGQILVTIFGSSTTTATFPIASGYSFTWYTDDTNLAGGGSTSIFSSSSSNYVTGVYDNSELISGISAPPPGDTPDYFTVMGSNGEAVLTSPEALTSLSLLWGSMDAYNTISFVGTNGTTSFTGNDVSVPPGEANGDQGAETTNRWVQFNISASDDVQEVEFFSTQNSFEFDNLYASAVPEPSIWLMLIAGFGLTGVMVRRRGGSTLTA